MKAILVSVIVLTAQIASAQVLIISQSDPQPTLAPKDCPCLDCDCVDCDGNCQPAKKQTPVSVVSRKVEIDRLENEVELLETLKPVKAAKAPDTVITQTGAWKWVQTGTQLECNGRTCRQVATYGWRFYKANPVPERKAAAVPVKNVQHLRYANTTNEGVAVESAPTNSTFQYQESPQAGYYSSQGPYGGSYANGSGCGGNMGSGCGGSSGCGGMAGGGCGGRGILGGRGLFGRRR